MTNLATKYRPTTFEEVVSQKSVTRILERQVETGQFVNCYLFSGATGTGKTTIARILANKINKGLGTPIEIDAASNNSVDNVRQIIEQADQRALDAEYKIYIIDECHGLSNNAWQALLKLIEEPPKYTIFMFCTTELQKVPDTIQNRCQQYRLTRIPDKDIETRLLYIAKQEKIWLTESAAHQITKMSFGSMRQAIAYLDKCKDYALEIDVKDVLDVLGDFSYDLYFSVINAIIDKSNNMLIDDIESIYNSGADLKLFIDLFFEFVLDLAKYIIFRSFDIIKIPEVCKKQVEYTINVEDASKYFNHLLDKLLELKVILRGDSNPKTTIEVFLLTRM